MLFNYFNAPNAPPSNPHAFCQLVGCRRALGFVVEKKFDIQQKHVGIIIIRLGVSPLQKKKESRVKLAPTSTSPYIFIEKTTETQTFMLPRSFRLGACCLTILTLLRQIPML